MRTAQQYKDLGIPSWYHEHARYYERLFTNVGWNEKQITEALKFGASYRGDGSEEDLTRQFRDLTAVIDAPDVDMAIDAGLGLRDNITMNGLEALPDLPKVERTFTTADEARLAEIRQIARNDPHAYEALQDEQLALLEAQQAAGKGIASSSPDSPATSTGDRLAQIREIARNDPQKYESDHALQQEQLALIQASLPTSAPAAAPQAAPSGDASSTD